MKAKHPGTILLFRLGDFYETFEEDAGVTSRVLGITLTKRGNGTAGDIPLAGFPYHALDAYLPKLVKAGLRVAICEQLEDPKLAKGIVKRDVVEVVTPGVAFSDKVLEQKQNNYLLAVALPHALATGDETIGIAYVDVTTAEFGVGELPLRQLTDQVASFAPSEILVQKRDMETVRVILKAGYAGAYSRLDDWIFEREYAHGLLTTHFKTRTLKGFGIEEMTWGVTAAGAIMNYLEETQKTNLDHIRKIVPFVAGDYILLDGSTKRNLEITQSIDGGEKGTLFSVLDRTRTPMGGRMLKNWISRPLRKLAPLRARLAAVEELAETGEAAAAVPDLLSGIGDLERLVSKISTNRANPREVVVLKETLAQVTKLKAGMKTVSSTALVEIRDQLQPLDPLAERISAAISDDPPFSLADGGVIRPGYSKELDTLREITRDGKSWIARLQVEERERTGISSLKVGFNNVFGYYIEVTNTHKEKVPESYVRKQTLANAERFITAGLKEYEEKILNAEERILKLESDLFGELRTAIAEHSEPILRNAGLIARADCLVSLAEVARKNHYVLPLLSEDSRIEIEGGRHPVIEHLLPPGDSYTPNDTLLDTEENQVLIITGPNMSGKSSYLRQVGLIVLLAHIGSFVPAKAARIGLVDRIYTRVGASDNIASGESTFLVEMHEAANILNTASSRSLILLDEVGRGTSTFDGISIAWALTEYIHDRIGAKTLFATHYHELNELARLFPRIKNLKVEVREYEDRVIFLHKVTPGFADHSYGIQVAQMAGLPAEVTERAKELLGNLEGSELNVHSGPVAKGRIAPPEIQMTLFDGQDKLREELQALEIDKMTPLEALQKLAELRQKHSR